MARQMQYELADPGLISARVFDDEIIIANFSSGIYYSLRFAAAEIWLGLMAGVPAERVVRTVKSRSRVSAQVFGDAAAKFIKTLQDESLIKPADRSIDASWQPRITSGSLDLPAVERFTDMEDLLLLDPIHDVGKTGWPDVLRKNAV